MGQARKPPFDLIEHRLKLAAVGARVRRLHPDDDAAVGLGGKLQIVSRAVTAVAHFHRAGFGIGRRHPALGLPLRMILGLRLGGLELCQLRQGLLDPGLAFTCGALLGGLDPGAALIIGAVGQGLELCDPGLGLGQAALERRLAVKRLLAGIGPHPRPVLRHAPQAEQALVHQHRQQLREQIIQRRAVGSAKITEQVMVDRDPAADPAIGVVPLTQPSDRARCSRPR